MDYKKLKFMAGLEIHQQLDSKKLFCNCPSILRDDPHDIEIKRKLRASAGEEGRVDIAAEHETKKDKQFIYHGYSDTTCAVEFDEEPPHDVNKKALNIILQICKLLNCKVIDEIQVMRKTVVDGSNTSGFQRTMLVGHGGKIETSKGIVRIASVALEEDSARRIGRMMKDQIKQKSNKENAVVYNLDRLGIPLVEVVTEPDIKSPEHCKETAEKIGMILRSTGKVKRGLGTIRQDVNVSINKGNRVEIKGFQDLRGMTTIIENEVKRQKKAKVKSEVRKATPDGKTEFLRPMPGAARLYPETDVKPVEITKELLKQIEIPETIDEKILKYEKQGLSQELARSLVKGNINLEDYNYKLDKTLIANILVEIPKEIKKRNEINYHFKEKEFRFILEALESKKINKDSIPTILIDLANGKTIKLTNYTQIDEKALEKEIKQLVIKNKELTMGALMGMVMKKFPGRVDGKLAASLIAKYKN
jgi:Glu-tRNA(Gln) amidotransferase subunit E-like FAD-binding protein